jgi:sialidase-1
MINLFTRTSVLALTLAARAQAGPLLTQTDVFNSGQDGYHTYRIPAVEAAPDGSLIAFAEARKYNAADPGFGKQDIDLVFKRSTNNGASWSPMTVLEDPGELWSAANPSTVVDRTNGRLWVFYLRSRPGCSTETSRPGTDDMQTQTRWSDDHGRTWSDPLDLTPVARDLNDQAWRASVPGPGGAIQTRKGRLIVPMWKAPFANFTLGSDDHGRTWQRSQLVPGRQGGDENQVVELADGRILMDIRQNSGPHRWLAESVDGGRTWAEPRPGITVTPVMCAIERFSLKTAGDDRNRILWTGPKGPERRRLVIRTSDDEGRTIANERLISDDYAAYSDLTILKDKTVGVLWERGVERGYQFITFTRLNREWIDAASSPASAPSPASFYQVISRGEAAGTYQAFTDICRLKNGDLLCVFYAGYGHVSLPREDFPKGGRVCSVRSKNEGRTWSAPRILFDGPSDDRDPHIAQMRDGAVVCSFFTYRPQPGGKVLCDTCLVTSRDGGETWDTGPQVVAPGWPSSAPVRELPDGTRILGVYREEGATAYGGVIRSTDSGKTWCEPIPIGQGSGVRLDAETDFVQLKNGFIYAALRGDRVNMHFATSPDGGLTWSSVKDIGFPGHCPHFTRLSTGEILLAHRLPLTALHVSRDEARTWQGPYQIDTTPGAYPSTVELKDGTVLVVYYEEGAGSAVRARRFKVKADGIEFLPLGSP